MKKFTLLFTFFSLVALAQNENEEMKLLRNAEMRAAAAAMNFAANPNTANYDLTYQKLEFTVNPAVYFVAGKVTSTFRAKSNMSTVVFDLYKKTTSPFTISSVKMGATNLTFVHNSTHELVITLPSTVTTGNSVTVEINYSGAPSTTEAAFTTSTHNEGTVPVLWTLSEPYGSRDWWPCKQDLTDKVDSIDIYITAPSQYKAAANGMEQSRIVNGANATTHFFHNYPIEAYLVAIAVTDYQIYNQQAGLGTVAKPFFPIVNYIYPESATNTINSLAVTPNIMNFFETKIGDYPFRNEKYGHAQFGWGGGMEHTTVSFMGSWGRGLIAHELAHQWFGNKITCGTWKDIWLNEGITEYMSGCVVENFDVPSNSNAFINWKSGKIASITNFTTGNLYLYDSQLTNTGRIFSGRLTYDKGSMVTHMLRFVMGDTNFFQALRNYLADSTLAYSHAITTQFQAHLEAVHGSSLNEFFNDWVFKEGYPIYEINASTITANQVNIQINQTQSITNPMQIGYVSYFEMPVPIRLTGASGQVFNTVLNNTFNGQTFIVNTPFTVTGVVFDPEKNIISKDNVVSLGVSKFDIEKGIEVYPNPASNNISIKMPFETQFKKVIFYNNLGQKVLESTTDETNISQLSIGLYTIQIESNEGVFHKKIVKN